MFSIDKNQKSKSVGVREDNKALTLTKSEWKIPKFPWTTPQKSRICRETTLAFKFQQLILSIYENKGSKMLPIPLKPTQRGFPAVISRAIHSKLPLRDYYEVLGVNSKASSAEIKEAFYRRSKELHPDSCTSGNATSQFVELKQAYDVLRRPADRMAYDNRGKRDYRNIYTQGGYSYNPGANYDFSDDWKRFWRETERSNYSESETKKRSEDQWKFVFQWTAFGAFLVILYNLGYVGQIYYRNYRLSKMVDEEEICKSFLRQSEYKDKEFNEIEKMDLAKMLKADVDEAWRRRQEELRGRNKNEIREEYRWLKAVQDADHTRKIKAKRAEMKRKEMAERWGETSHE